MDEWIIFRPFVIYFMYVYSSCIVFISYFLYSCLCCWILYICVLSLCLFSSAIYVSSPECYVLNLVLILVNFLLALIFFSVEWFGSFKLYIFFLELSYDLKNRDINECSWNKAERKNKGLKVRVKDEGIFSNIIWVLRMYAYWTLRVVNR